MKFKNGKLLHANILLSLFFDHVRARNLVVSDFRSESNGSQFESGC